MAMACCSCLNLSTLINDSSGKILAHISEITLLTAMACCFCINLVTRYLYLYLLKSANFVRVWGRQRLSFFVSSPSNATKQSPFLASCLPFLASLSIQFLQGAFPFYSNFFSLSARVQIRNGFSKLHMVGHLNGFFRHLYADYLFSAYFFIHKKNNQPSS